MRATTRTAILVCLLLTFSTAATAATFTVTKTTDTNDGACNADCSLREAVVAANELPGADIIVLPAGTYLLTIADTSEDAAANGDLDVTDALTITGAGMSTTIIDGNSIARVFHVLSAPFTVTDVTIRNGNATGFGGGINHEGISTLTLTRVTVGGNRSTQFGGGININNNANAFLTDCNVTNNVAQQFGGGINNNVTGTLTVQGGTIAGNTAQGFGGGGINNNSGGAVLLTTVAVTGNTALNGGGINNNSLGSLNVSNSTIGQNVATGSIGGGGILNNSSGPTVIVASVISGNTGAGFGGGGVDNNFSGNVSIENSTISGNTSTGSNGGGGIYNNNSSGSIQLLHVTVANNASTNGGRSLHDNGSGGNIIVRNSIVANPTSGANCGGAANTTQGNNVVSDASCAFAGPGDLQNTNPLLAPLANNGGPTFTHALCTGSPAINAAAPGLVAVDQRLVTRPIGGAYDIGAYEGSIACGGPVPTLSINNVTANEGNAGGTPFNFTVTLSAASASTVTVAFATADGTAIAGSDYTTTSGTLTFAPGVLTQPIAVSVLGDTTVEATEAFVVNLSAPTNATIATAQGVGTITNDDVVVPLPTLSINSVAANEGNAGAAPLTFAVTLSAGSASTVTVNFATADGTAAAGSDYTATSGTLTFAPGVLTQPITVSVLGDTAVEATESFVVNLSAPSNATIAAGQGTGTITNDDAAVPPPPTAPIPTLSEWALLLLSLMLGGIAWTQVRSRRWR